MLAWVMNLGFAATASGAVVVVPDAAQTPAGRRRRKYYVEIDDEEFEVESAEQALALLDRARETAKKSAELLAAEVLAKVTPKATRIGKASKIILKPPVITGAPELKADIKRAQEAISKVYKEAELVAELQLLLLMKQIQDDEETILLLM